MTHFDFLGKSKYFLALSMLLVVASIVALVTVGLRLGMDFTGGLQLTVFYPTDTTLSDQAVRAYLEPLLADVTPAPNLSVQSVTGARTSPGEGTVSVPGKVISLPSVAEEIWQRVRSALTEPPADSGLPQPIEFSITEIGPQVSGETVTRAWQAVLISLAAMLLYIAFRFRLKYGVAAVVSLIHDVILMVGLFAVTQLEFDLTAIAAILTVIGYTLNDKIVIYDRVRENTRIAKKAPLIETMNKAINQTLSRTLITGSATLIAIIVLFIFGGRSLQPFALAMLVGVVVGTYSSIFIANPVIAWWTLTAERIHARRR